MSSESLPLFPLRTVLFPGGTLSLRIFEARYLDLVGRCMRSASPFGVSWIRAGGEVGPVTDLATTGTSARILDFHELPDGLLGLSCRGEQRFRIRRRWTEADGLHVAEVDWLPEPAAMPVPDAYRPLERLLQRIEQVAGRTAAPGAAATGAAAAPGDGAAMAFRLAEFLPLDAATRLELLEADDAAERLALLAAHVRVPTPEDPG